MPIDVSRDGSFVRQAPWRAAHGRQSACCEYPSASVGVAAAERFGPSARGVSVLRALVTSLGPLQDNGLHDRLVRAGDGVHVLCRSCHMDIPFGLPVLLPGVGHLDRPETAKGLTVVGV